MPEAKKRTTLYSHSGFRYNDDAQSLCTRAHNLLSTLFEEYFEKGYNPREISHLMHSAVTELELVTILKMKPGDDQEADNVSD